MTVFDEIMKDQLREFLVKNWMTHDGADLLMILSSLPLKG